MDVGFASKRIFKLCTKKKKRGKKLGYQRGRELKVALDELDAAQNLAEVSALPHRRLHRLSGDYEGAFSVDIDNQYRIYFDVVDEDDATDDDGNLDFEAVTSISIFWVGDPHD